MKIDYKEITIAELIKGYKSPASGDEGVIGYDGDLDIRPPFQREFVYDAPRQEAVIRSVLAKFPLNIMYWACIDNNRFELLDGQQRTLSICRFWDCKFTIKIDGKRYQYDSLPKDKQQIFDNYKLTVYQCDGTDTEKMEWFSIVNIAGMELSKQELRNAIYSGPWVNAAKRYFGHKASTNAAYRLGQNYVSMKNADRQALLELAIKWIIHQDEEVKDIDEYMAQHRTATSADDMWEYYKKVISWAKNTFPNNKSRNKLLEKVDWNELYLEHGNHEDLDPNKLEEEIKRLIQLKESGVAIQKLAGVYPYVLDGNEQHLNLRTFTPAVKQAKYEEQKGKCNLCLRKKKLGEMHADHITPWKEGGLTIPDNLQMVCAKCNLKKGAS